MINLLLKIILCVSLLLLVYYIVSSLARKAKFKKMTADAKVKFKKELKSARRYAGKLIGRVQAHFAMMNPYERDKSKFYKYYHTMQTALIAGGMDNYIGVELLFVMILLTSIATSILLTFGLSFFMTILVFTITFVALHTLVLFTSRSHIFNRVILLMKTEDMLCSSMEQGVVKAIQENITYIDSSIVDPFENFLASHLIAGMNIQDALNALNADIGPLYNTFCERAYQHYKENDAELLNGFRGIIEDNNRKRDRLLIRKNIFDSNMRNYGILLLVSIGFVLFMSSVLGGTTAFLASSAGRITTIISICTGAIGFIVSQMVYTGGIES